MQTKKRNLSPAVRILSGLCICAFLALLVLLIVVILLLPFLNLCQKLRVDFMLKWFLLAHKCLLKNG